MAIDPTRLYTALLNTGLQNKDNPLYQVIHDLIKTVASINTTIVSGGGGSSVINNIQNNLIQILDASSGGDSDLTSDVWFPPGNPSASGIDAFIPYHINPSETFIVPINKQGLFAMNIDNEGILVVDGFLIEVA